MVEDITNTKIGIIGLFRTNYLKQVHIRGMGQKLKKNHTTLLPHLKDLVKDKILNHKTIGKNKYYFLNLYEINTRNWLVLAEIAQTTKHCKKYFQIYQISNWFSELKLNNPLILFGSYADETFNKASDIDILTTDKLSKKNSEKMLEFTDLSTKEINIMDTTFDKFKKELHNRDPLITEVVKKHVILQNIEPFVDTLWDYFKKYSQED
ncbi:nucleotidyltransferase domain-containing protein [Candidatus Woesearchaeota archaeon]|jgi:predicted nucleotidyltransferase|nr:nucleotidyltransferase domain-containing protein [Candidatus Woesearchaeota archaeon]